ncbi:MAG: hypothetical protein BWK80_25695 [Desulfobacteraceae bacterium IS3]|nr:MAG: hypothetical protein BWK80_25695 [Desulfobacteraceae bacterium IS3]HAO20265.1 hypothetical protein [Desulfobacteraceae bacterium]
MFKLNADRIKNRLYLKLDGTFSEADVKSAEGQILRAARTLRPGFDIINDISGFKPVKPEVSVHIAHIQDEVMKMSVGRIVRVVGGNALGKMQLSRTSREAGYNALAAATLQEAEKLLDSP